MLLENRLKELAQENNELLDTYSMWKVMKKNITDTLNNISIYFPHFSLHNATHSNTICVQVERLLGEERIKKLSFSDIFLMLLAFYMHDIGMSLKFKDINKDFQSEEFKQHLIDVSKSDNDLADAAKRILAFCNSEQDNKTYKNDPIKLYEDIVIIIEDLYRRNHATRSANTIKNGDDLYNIGLRFTELLANICEMHQNDIEKIMNLPYKSNGMFDDYIHPRFIAAMLCLGDLLDLDTDRFNSKLIRAVSPMPNDSELHREKHKSIRQFLVEPSGIEIVSDSEKIDVYRIIREWVEWIKKTCDFLSINWSSIAPCNYGIAPHIKKSELYINGNKKWLELAELKYSISNQRIFELLRGSSIYNNKFVCIREIIQNSIDATLFRVIESYKKNKKKYDLKEYIKNIDFDDFLIEGHINRNKNGSIEVNIRDYGIGISLDDIKFMASVTNEKTNKKKNLLENIPNWFKPSGAFGLGIQSVFQLTDRFQIITKCENEETKQISFESLGKEKGYITIEKYEGDFLQGTQIKFEIDRKNFDRYDMIYRSDYYYKTKTIEELILDTIKMLYYNIDSKNRVGDYRNYQKQRYDYFPVKLYICDDLILEYKTILNKMLSENIELNDNGCNIIKTDVFNEENMCLISLLIQLNANEHNTYGDAEDLSSYKYSNDIFYKNVPVFNEVGAFINREIFLYFKFDANFFADTSDVVLQMSRNLLQKRYVNRFYKMIENSIENVIKKIIDKVIDTKKLAKIDMIFILFQFARYYRYKDTEIKKIYGPTLKKIKFNNYYLLDGKEITFKFKDLCDKDLFFKIADIENDIIHDDVIVTNKLPPRQKCLLLNKKDVKKHILNHKAVEVFIDKIDGKYCKILKARAFESNKKSIVCEVDEFIFLENIVFAILNKYRCISCIKKYEKLMTPLNTINQMRFTNRSRQCIELPFNESIFNDLRQRLRQNKYINYSENFLDKTISSEKFKTNIKYILNYQRSKTPFLNEKEIEEKYTEFAQEILGLLQNTKYKSYIDYLVEKRKTNIPQMDIYGLILNSPYVRLS
jgi:hypothetical protein